MKFFTASVFSAIVALAHASTIGFTQAPAGTITAGQPVQLAWTGGLAGSPVTITLKQGDPSNLITVAIITGDATGTTFTWTPSTSLPNDDNYALEISQGTGFGESNYSGEFSLQGGSTAAPSSAAASTGATSTGIVTVTSANSTQTVAHTVFATASASGTGNSVPRNTTFVAATGKTASATGGLVAGPTSAGSSGGASSASSAGIAAGQVIGTVGSFGMALLGLAALL